MAARVSTPRIANPQVRNFRVLRDVRLPKLLAYLTVLHDPELPPLKLLNMAVCILINAILIALLTPWD